jgi:hypothetical protein
MLHYNPKYFETETRLSSQSGNGQEMIHQVYSSTGKYWTAGIGDCKREI